jgi:adenylylsulfate kinase-like enzyme
MIWWFYGESGSGKTTLTKRLLGPGVVHLDGDEMRATISKDLDYTEEARKENNYRIARLAKLLDDKGFDVVVSTICPYEELRKEVYFLCKCRFVKVEGEYRC